MREGIRVLRAETGIGLGLEVREERKMKMRRRREEEKSRRRILGERSLGGLYLFQAFAMENDSLKFSGKVEVEFSGKTWIDLDWIYKRML